MSALPAIRIALEEQLATATPGMQTAPENSPFVPTTGVAYQQPFLMPATPANFEIGPAWVEQGIFQINGFWPKDRGAAVATAWAEQVRAAFPYRATLTSGGITVHIINTTEIGPARPDGDRFMVPVKVRWDARIGG